MTIVHPRPIRRWPAAVTALAVALLVSVPAGAHTEVQSAEPGVASEVTGPVDSVTLVFLSEVMPDASIELGGPGGPVVADGPTTLADDGRTLTRSFDAVDEPGAYVVRYTFTATDGDAQEESYRFRIVTVDDPELPVGALVAVIAGVVVLVLVLVRRRRSPS